MRLSAHIYRRLMVVACAEFARDETSKIFSNLFRQTSSVTQNERDVLLTLRDIFQQIAPLLGPINTSVSKSIQDRALQIKEREVLSQIKRKDILDFLPTAHDISAFYEHFFLVNGICELLDSSSQWDTSFRKDIVPILFLAVGSSIRSIPAEFAYSVGQLNASGRMYFPEKDPKSMHFFLTEYLEFYHVGHSIAQQEPKTPNKKELARRQRISQKKREQNHACNAAIASCIEQIRKFSTENIRNACKQFFDQNKSKLKELNIGSPRTLENYCSRRVLKRDSNTRRTEKNCIDISQKINDEKLFSFVDKYKLNYSDICGN